MFGPVRKSQLQALFEESLKREPPKEFSPTPQDQSRSLKSSLTEPLREAVVGLVVRHSGDSDDLEFLLTLRSDELKEHPSQVAFPGGLLEEGEGSHHLKALDREVSEEIGISEGRIIWSPQHWEILPSLHGIRVYPYLGFIERSQCPEELLLQQDEVADADWVDVWKLFDAKFWGRRPLARAPWEWRGWEHATWGLTAAFLALFVKRVSGRLPG